MIEPLSIEKIEQEIIDDFSLFDNWEEKYEYIIDMGKKLPPLDDIHKKEENIIKGCQSTVWLVAEQKDGRIYFKADSDAVIVKGLISLLIRVLSGQTATDILGTKLDFINKIGMMQHLAQTRSNGLLSMIKQMKHYALAFNTVAS
ncbi:MAG: SufE family protein [Chitinophagaceae bacterium]|jgi:cysteine desulfuration protein SufE|nr:SufE family protein [Chitinophagaceae bacterium]OQY93679.1 MAG: Fe-S metabolism protein SufE [Sphingobacteriales bacterium UTBCD1]